MFQKHLSTSKLGGATELQVNTFKLSQSSSVAALVDRPTQLICIWIFICWVGGGDPRGAADFCFSCLYCQKKQARSNFFSKYPCHVHKECLETTKRRTILGKFLQKTCLFQASQPPGQPKSRIPEMSQLKSGIPETSRLKSGILERNSSPPVCKIYCACVNVSSGYSLNSWILNCIREFWHL